MKAVINVCYGGFGLSDKAIEKILQRKGLGCYRYVRSGEQYIRFDPKNIEPNTSYDFYYATVDCGKAIERIPEESGWWYWNLERTDKELISVVEELGEKANCRYSKLKIVETPDDVQWEIDDYDGWESVEEVHRSWS